MRSIIRWVTIGWLIIGAILAAAGQYTYIHTGQTDQLAFWLGIAAVFWLMGLLQTDSWQHLRQSGGGLIAPQSFRWSRWRIALLLIGFGWMAGVFYLSWEAVFTLPLVIAWLSGIVYWWVILLRYPIQWRWRLPVIAVNHRLLAFIVLAGVAGITLFYQLDYAPAWMTGDHLEKVRDINRINVENEFPIYYGAVNGREPLHFYIAYALSPVSGVSYLSFKIASAIIALLTLPAIYWMGKTLDGRLTGWLAVMLAVSASWLMISGRSGFRAGSAALFSTLLLAAYWRALHSGRRADFLLTGLILGFGMYSYTAFRFTPLLIITGGALRWLLTPRRARWALIGHLFALIALAAMIYMPLLSYSIRYPEIYWERSTELLGDLSLTETVRLLADGMAQTFAMFNIISDPVEINDIQGYWPAVDPVTGGLFILGLLLWVWRVIQNRRWLELLLPLAFIIYCLPSGLAVTAQTQMPSARRAVIALPLATLFAGYTLSFIGRMLTRLQPALWMRAAIVTALTALLIFHINLNWDAYFNNYTRVHNAGKAFDRMVAEEIQHFESIGGDIYNAYVVFISPHYWLHSRMIAAWIGHTDEWDNVLIDPTAYNCLVRKEANQSLLFAFDGSTHWGYFTLWLESCFPQAVVYTYHHNYLYPSSAVIHFAYVP